MNESEPGDGEMSQDYSGRPFVSARPRSIVVRLLLRSGIAHTEAAANKIAIGIAIICFACAGYLAFGGSSAPTNSAPQPPIGSIGPNGAVQP